MNDERSMTHQDAFATFIEILVKLVTRLPHDGAGDVTRDR
jgi:ribosome maturation factor RimP